MPRPRPSVLPAAVPAVLVLLAAAAAAPAQSKYSIREAESPPPKELAPAVAGLLDGKSVQLLDGKETALCEVWFRKEVPAMAAAEQVKNGLTFREVPETTVLGAMRIDKTLSDYRKQKIKPGVYTLRLGYQPMDGDHMGTAPYGEFCLLIPAAEDKSAEPLGTAKELQEHSTKASGSSHPAVFLLFPLKVKPDAKAQLAKDGDNHWTVTRPVTFKAADLTTTLGVVLTLIGTSSAA